MKTEPLIKLLSWDEARPHASTIRFTVFCEEQGVPPEIELDENDSASNHAVVFDGKQGITRHPAFQIRMLRFHPGVVYVHQHAAPV